jgi:urocanate hydratase
MNEFIAKKINGQSGSVLSIIDELCALGKSIGVLIKDITAIIRDLLVIKTCDNANKILALPDEKFAVLSQIANSTNEQRLLRMLEIFSNAENSLKYTNHPRVLFESASIKACRPESDYDLDALMARVQEARKNKEVVSFAYQGNVVDLWEYLVEHNISVDLGSDQTSLHNPWAGGYYPVGVSFEEAQDMMANKPELFKEKVQESLRRHVAAINKLTAKGMYFFDYGNAFLLESSRAGADIMKEDGTFRYPSYVQDIMGPMCFDYGFGPFRWVCTSSKPEDLDLSDKIAMEVLEEIAKESPVEIQQQMRDNITWIKGAKENNLVVGSQARILYADAEGRTKIASAFNKAIKEGRISAPIVLGRDHHDVSGTDSPFRETSNIYDGSSFTADMAVHNCIGDSFRGATWVSIHNGGGVGWGEVINGGFGMVIDGSDDSERRLRNMLFWDVNNGISRRSWARNEGAIFAIKRAMEVEPKLKVTLPNIADDALIDSIF